jgi:dihydrofolate reductase
MTSIIVAASENNVIGKNNDLLWTLPTDMRFFKETTMGGTVIMGRKTWESIPPKYRPLNGRINIVISRQKDYTAQGCLVVDSLTKAFNKAPNDRQCFIIGVGQIYKESINFVDRIYLTSVNTTIDGDTYFPELIEERWELKSELNVKKDIKNKYDMSFKVYDRFKPKEEEEEK